MVYTISFLYDDMDVDDNMSVMKLMKPRNKLVKALCREKYGQRYWNANEMMAVIHENKLSLFHEGKDRTETNSGCYESSIRETQNTVIG